MEILTLLKANIRRKKGSFVSVILLTLIIAMSVTTVLSIRESALNGVNKAHELCGTPNLTVLYNADSLTGEIVEKVKNDDRVADVRIVDAILSEKATMNNVDYTSIMSLCKADESIRLLNSDLRGFSENAPKPQKGEIYVTQGFLTYTNGKVGQKVVFKSSAEEYEFTVKGIVLEPTFGAFTIGWKGFYISDEDYSKMYSAILNAEQGKKGIGLGNILKIKKSDGCTLSDAQFRRALNLDTGVTDMAFGSTTKDMSIHYTTLFLIIVCSVLLVFIMVLLAIVVIVMVHSISVEIETNYVTFGVLKAQGFDKKQIRMLFLAQYLLAEIIGAVLGIALSIPLIGAASNIFVTITAVPAVMSVPIGTIALILAGLFVLSAVLIFLVTIKAGKIPPVRAISGAKNEIYFDSRLNAPISRGLLSPSLAFRQFTSAKRRYAGTLVIVVILVFFMMTVTVLANTVTSKSALESMGATIYEIAIIPKKASFFSDSDLENIEKEIERFSPIRKKYYTTNSYFSFDGEEMMGSIFKDPSVMPTLKGRTPIYDNEIAVSPMLLDEFGLKIGDEITVGWQGKRENYLITGTVQIMNDLGRCFVIPLCGAEKIGFDNPLWGCYSLEKDGDKTLNEKIAAALNEKFGDMLEAEAESGEFLDNTTETAINAVQLIIYVFSVLFSLIVVHMVCSKAFIQERTDIGIYKAVGFHTSGLRMQFACRFLTVSMIGAAVGGALSYFLSGKMLGVLLRSIGITSFNTSFGFLTFAVPIVVICASFLIFSYLVSGKIRKVKIRELVTE